MSMVIPNELLFAEVEDRLGRGESTTIRLVGTSMHPALKNGRDLVTLAPMDAPPVRGEVYLFRYNGRHILHRLLSADDGECRFRGDNCLSCEVVLESDVVARLVEVKKGNRAVSTRSVRWKTISRLSLMRGLLKRLVCHFFGSAGRRRYRLWYFFFLAMLMWLPLNGLAEMMPNYVLGLRADHFVHAAVYIPCTWFLMDLFPKRGLSRALMVLVLGFCVALVTEGGQYLLPYRGFDVNDIVANFCGILLGWMPALGIYFLKKR